jgi:hypothetical protein
MRRSSLPLCLWQGAHKLVDQSARVYQGRNKEGDRQHDVLTTFSEIWPGLHFGGRAKMDGAVVVPMSECVDAGYLACVIEFKNEPYSSGSASLQGQRYIQVSW